MSTRPLALLALLVLPSTALAADVVIRVSGPATLYQYRISDNAYLGFSASWIDAEVRYSTSAARTSFTSASTYESAVFANAAQVTMNAEGVTETYTAPLVLRDYLGAWNAGGGTTLVDSSVLTAVEPGTRASNLYLYGPSNYLLDLTTPPSTAVRGLDHRVLAQLVFYDDAADLRWAVSSHPSTEYVTVEVDGVLYLVDGFDADGDGVLDEVDACPGADDTQDADEDGVADGCDACPVDAANDSDGDGACDSDDPCALDVADDADGDGLCADEETPGCEDDPDNDADGDGVCAPSDPCPSDPANDADGDGLCADEDPYDDCPDADDTDGDGTADACDACPLDIANDRDGDGACDSDDACPFDAADDQDGDAICDSEDLCPLDGDDDLDEDGICGDVDACPASALNDVDGDGLCEGVDNCPTVSNAGQSDGDGDGEGDACEVDIDADGLDDDVDNCPLASNADQVDTDGDGAGDPCDADDDADGVGDDLDACPDTDVGAATSPLDGCSVAQSCPSGNTWKNHGAYVSCVSRAAEALVDADVMTEAEKDATVAAAAASRVGRR